MLQTPAAASRHHSLLRQHSASGRQGEMDAAQQRLYASYAIMYDAHAQANQLLLDCIAVLAAQYGAAADDDGTASRAPPPTAVEATTTRYTPLSDREDRRQAVEELLVCFTAMQRVLSSSTMPTALAQPEVSAKGKTERDDEEEEEEDANLSFEQEVREAYAYLLTCLPTDWQQAVLSSSPSSQGKASVVRDTVTAHGKQRTNVTTTEVAAAAATRTSLAAAEGGFVSPSPLCAAPPAHDGDGAHPPTPTAVPDRVLTCPADIVQLALLLRRHWALHRNVTVAIPALMDVLALLEDGRADTTDACCTSGIDTVPGNRPCSLPLSVAMALAVLHLSYAQLTIDGAATLHPSAPASPLYTPAEEHLVASAALPSVASAATTAITTLPLQLWRAYTQTHHAGSASAEGIRRSGPHTTLQEFSSSLTSLSVAAAAVTPPSYAIARQLTKQLFSWEAHIAAYVNAQLGEHDRAGVRSSVYSTITNNNGDDGDAKDEDNADSDVEFLRATQAELTVLCGACHSAELMWFSLYALLNPHEAHDTEAKRSRSALASVAKRAAKLAALLQTLWDSSATAQLLLPGVLLWCGECRLTTGGVKSTLNDVRPTDPFSKQREEEEDQQQQQQRAYWQRGYDLGVRAFGRSHPLVVQLSALLAAPSRKGTVATTTGPTTTTVNVTVNAAAAAAAGKAEEDSLLRQPTPHVASPSSPPSRAAAPIPVLRSPLPPAAPQPPLPQLARSPLPAASAPRAATANTTVSHAPPSLLGSHGAAPPPVRSTWSAHQPDPSRVFVTAYSSPRRPPAAAVGGFAGGPSSPLHRTFPLPLTSAGAGGTAPSTSRGGSHRQGPLDSTTSRSARDAEATKQRPPTRLAALRNCHRLAHPADAFGLRSTVADAVFEDDLENMDLLPGQKGKRSGAASGASSRKGKGRGAGGAAAQRDGTASTAALLLSASVGDGGGETGAGSADGEGSAAAAAVSQYGRRRKKRRPDRVLLPPVASAPRPPPSKQNVVRGKAQIEQQQQQHSVLEPPSGDSDPFAVFSQRSEEPLWSPRGGDHDAALTGSDTAAEGMGAALHNSGSGSNMDAASVLKKNSHATHPPHEDSVAPSVEEEDEEDYERETLPERNARLQREVRMYFQGLNERRVRAAATIQRAWRCCKARQTLRERQQMLYRYVYIIQKAAALALEGFILSVWAQRRRRAAQQSRRIADAQRETLERRQLAAAAVLTRAGRRWVQRQCERRRLRAQLNLERDARLQQYEATAVMVQRWWRAVVPQKAYWRRRHREVAEQRRLQAEADRLARAATVIQRRVRGMQARVRVAALRRRAAAEALALRRQRDAAATVLFIVLQEHALRQARQTRETADRQAKEQRSALCIAENWRATLERRRLAVAVQRARQLRTAAALIQRAWRRYSAGRLRRHLRQTRSATLRDRLALELRAWGSVVLLQSAARGAMARLQVAALKAREGLTFEQTVTLLQSVGRGFAARRGCRQAWTELQDRQRIAAAQAEERRNAAATRTQALLRARSSALAVRRALQVCLTERVHVYGSAAAEMRRDAAAAVLQRAVRRHQQRQRATLARAEAAAALCFLHSMAQRVQRGWRCFHARQERRRRAAAVRACALRRQQAEEVLELVWRDQRRELEVLCSLEHHYIAEAEHAARVALYRAWTHKGGKRDEGAMGGAEQQQQQQQWRKASCGGDALERWAALYVD